MADTTAAPTDVGDTAPTPANTPHDTKSRGFNALHLLRELLAIVVLGELALILLLLASALWKPEHSLQMWATAMSRADSQQQDRRELLAALSHHAYLAELLQEYLTLGWTSKQALGPVLADYNESIARARNLAGQVSAASAGFDANVRDAIESADQTIKSIDDQLRKLTDELVAVNVQETKDHADPEKATATAEQLLPLVQRLKSQVSSLPPMS